MEPFVKSQTAGIDGGEIDVIVEGFDVVQNASDFFSAQNRGESSFGLGSEDSKDVPVSLEDVFVEEPNPAIADPHSTG